MKSAFVITTVVIFLSASICHGMDYSFAGTYENIRVAYDYGLSYELMYKYEERHAGYTVSKEKSLYKAEDEGRGISFQYSPGAGLFMLNNRPGLGIGLLLESQLIYSRDSSIFSLGAGIESRLLYFFSFLIGGEYSYFSKELPVIEEYDHKEDDAPILKKESPHGNGMFFGWGLHIPLSKSCNIFSQALFYSFDSDISTSGWERSSLRFGVEFVR